MAFGDLLQRKVPVVLQSEAPECGIACLAMVASFHGHRTDDLLALWDAPVNTPALRWGA